MARTFTVFLFGAALIVGATMAMLTPRGELQAREGDCRQMEVQIDEGYGISATMVQQVCGSQTGSASAR